VEHDRGGGTGPADSRYQSVDPGDRRSNRLVERQLVGDHHHRFGQAGRGFVRRQCRRRPSVAGGLHHGNADADADPGHADTGHADTGHADADPGHADTGHADTGYTDTGHADSGYADADSGYADSGYADTDSGHADTGYTDTGHADAHGDPDGDDVPGSGFDKLRRRRGGG
jgi:hypothetical protein